MAVGREVGTAVGVIIALAAINALLLTLNFLRLRRERRRLWVSNDGIMRGPTSFWAFEQLESDHLRQGYFEPLCISLLRILQFVMFAFVIFWQAFGPEEDVVRLEPRWLTYFSNWTFMGFGLQALLGAYLAASEAWGPGTLLQAGKLAQEEDHKEMGLSTAGRVPLATPAGPESLPQQSSVGGAGSTRPTTKQPGAAAEPEGPYGEGRAGLESGGDEEGGWGESQAEEPHPGRAKQPQLPSRRPLSLLDKLYLLLFQTFFCASIVATIFYWSSEYASGEPVLADNLLRHGAHSFLMILDLFLSRIPVVAYHIFVVVLYHTAYAVFMFIYSLESWVYACLAWEYQLAPVFYTILIVMIFFSFAFMYFLAFLRERFIVGGK